MWIVTEVEVMTPTCATWTVGHAHMDSCFLKIANRYANVDGSVDECLHPGPSLRVPDVEVNGTCVGLLGIANDPQGHSKADTVSKDRGVEEGGGILQSESVAVDNVAPTVRAQDVSKFEGDPMEESGGRGLYRSN